jgi:pyruvate dehydrogenase E2 component (dihydrolipoamide acetyltransferase)
MSFEFRLPNVGENVDKADIGALRVQEGDIVSAEQIVLEIETDKAVFELPCPQAGKIAKIHVKQGQTVKVGDLLLSVEPAGAAPPPTAAPAKTPAAAAPSATASAPAKAAPASSTAAATPAPAARVESNGAFPTPPAGPATRRLARELGVDLRRLRGTGPGGRITLVDVHQAASRASGGGGGVVIPPLPDFTQFGPVDRVPLNKLSKTAAANLSLSWQVVPHVTQHEMVDVTELEAGRKRFVSVHAKSADMPKITMTVLATKAVVAALKAFPNFNASFDAATGEVLHKKYYNIGIAVDTEHGLLVPVVKDADKKSVLQIAAEITELAG